MRFVSVSLARLSIVIATLAPGLLGHAEYASAANVSHLNWGKLPAWEDAPAHPLPPDIKRALEVASGSLNMQVKPVETLYLAGTLNQDPRHVDSDRAKENFPAIFDLAICARVAQEPLRTQCLNKVASALTVWAQTYRPTGHPINEAIFVPLFQAIDLVVPRLSLDKSRVLIDWVRGFVVAGDKFYAPLWPSHGYTASSNTALSNNWMAWHLVIRAMAAEICDDRQLQNSTRTMLSEFAGRNFLSVNGQQNGETIDFVARDALHYHVYDLLPLVQIVLYAPSSVDARTRSLIDMGLNFLKPFYTGKEQHIEFLHSTVPFDIQRKLEDKGTTAYQNKPWNPQDARILFRLARPAFPDIQPWTANVVDAHYDTWVKPLAAIYGEPLNLP